MNVKSRTEDMPLQAQADIQQALLYIQELADAGKVSLQGGSIDAEKCRAGLAELKRQGIEPNERRASGLWALKIAAELGVKVIQ